MNPHIIELPKKIYIGYNIIRNTPQYLENLGLKKGSRVTIVTGPNVYNIIAKEVVDSIRDYGYDTQLLIADKPTKERADELYTGIREYKADVVIGIGGGKAIDVAKYISSRINKPFISIPTAASHDGIASPFASLKGLNGPTSVKAVTPIAIIADIDVISRAPRRLLRAGVGDLVGKLVAVKDWRLAHKLKGEYYGEYAAQLALLSAKHVIRYHELIASGNPEGVRIVVEALISSSVAMCIAGSSRPASGSEHLFSHALDIVAPKPALHGEQVGVGTIMMLYLYGDPRWKKVKKILQKIGAPTTAKELGIPDHIIIKALTIAHKVRKRYTILGDNGLTWEAAEKLAKETGVID